MDSISFSFKTNQKNLSRDTSSEKYLNLQNFTPIIKRQTSLTGIETRVSSDIIHTPVFNKNVRNRHLIDQGLDITRHKARLENRQVKDKSYYMGLLYQKGYEIGREIRNLGKQMDLMRSDQSTYSSYKQKAANQASELKQLQATLADFNLVDDLYNTDPDIDVLVDELKTIKSENERKNAEVEELFELNKKKEDLVRELETDISQEKYVADILSATSSPNLKIRYKSLKKLDDGLKSNQVKLEEELKILKEDRKKLEDQCKLLGKSDAYSLIEKLNQEQIKRDNLMKEQFLNDKSSLLNKKRENNDLIKCLGNQTRNIKHQIQQVEFELENMNKDNETTQTERVEKMAKLKYRDRKIDNFLDTFQKQQTILLDQLSEFQNRTKRLLRKMSSRLSFDDLEGNYNDLKSDYSIVDEKKTAEEQRAKDSLKREILELLAKDELEDRLVEEIKKLKDDLSTKQSEIDNFSNVEQLKKKFETKEKELLLEVGKIRLQKDSYDAVIKDMQIKCETLENQLQQSNINKELSNLEKQWHYLEQINFEMKEFLDEAKVSGDYSTVKESTLDTMKQLNQTLLEI